MTILRKNHLLRAAIVKSKIFPLPALCEDLPVWAAGNTWSMKLIHEAFLSQAEVPVGSLSNDIVRRRFEIHRSLGFPAQFLVSLPEAKVCGAMGFIVLSQGAYIVQGNWRASNVIGHPTVLSTPNNQRKKLAGNWYSIRSYYSYSYHHWFWDDLPRLLAALIHLPTDTRFIVGEPLLEFQKESLKALGIYEDRIIVQPSDCDYICDKLYFATPLGHSEYAATAPDVAQNLHKVFTSNSFKSRRVYISRSLARYRRLVNESDLLPIIKDFGFELIHAENLSFESQVKLFSEAEVILSPHGAGLTNMLFSPSPALILELFEPTAARPHYWMMSHALGHNYACLVGETIDQINKTRNDPDFTICPAKFIKFLKNNLN